MNREDLGRLLRQYFNNTINRDDCIELLNYLNEHPEEVAEYLNGQNFNLNEGPEFNKIQATEVYNRITADSRFKKDQNRKYLNPIIFYQSQWFKIAAILLVFIAVALVVFKINNSTKPKEQAFANQHPAIIVPGGKKATLTLANGKTIVLNDAKSKLLLKAGKLKISKTDKDQLIYSAVKGNNSSAIATNYLSMNTLSTPKGGGYQVILADGTKVWLNSASSISYPVEFIGNERHVKLSGEAYFEVAKNKEKPFFVDMNNVYVKVLGTHFNISAYNNDDDITTTLLEGSVQLSKNGNSTYLKPGQQGVVTNTSNSITVSTANTEEAMAWMHGYFIFNDENITTIMKKVSRWYDVDVEYRGDFKDEQFGGTYNRSKSINELLQYLGKIGKINFNIEGRRVIVMK